MFYLKEPNSKNKTLIIVQYYVAKEKAKFRISTNIKINPENWNKKTRLPIRKRGGGGIASERITRKLLEINKKIADLKYKHGVDLTIGDLKLAFGKSSPLTYLIEYFEFFIDERIKLAEVSDRSIKKYKVVLNKLIDFQVYSKHSYKIAELNHTFYIKLITYLREKHNLFDNTLHRYLNVIKTFIHWLEAKNIKVNKDYKKISIKTHETDDIALTQAEVKLLEDALLEGAKDRARDLFLVGVYTALRFSDYSMLEKADVRDGLIEKRAAKTKAISYIPLTQKLKTILNKYDWKLPKISSQKFNPHIKKICRGLGINSKVKKTSFQGKNKNIEIKEKWEMVGSHTARRTGITIMAEKNIPDHIIMAISGIKDPKTLKKYKKVNKGSIVELTKQLF